MGNIRTDETSMDFPLVRRRELHIIAPHIPEPAVRIVRTREHVAFELYFLQRINGRAGRRIAVQDPCHGREFTILPAEQTDGTPDNRMEKEE